MKWNSEWRRSMTNTLVFVVIGFFVAVTVIAGLIVRRIG